MHVHHVNSDAALQHLPVVRVGGARRGGGGSQIEGERRHKQHPSIQTEQISTL